MTQNDAYQTPPSGQSLREQAAMPYTGGETGSASTSAIDGVRARNEQKLMNIDGVEGVGIGQGPVGDDAIVVYLRDASVRQRVPTAVEGYPVVSVVTGPIDAYGSPDSPHVRPRSP